MTFRWHVSVVVCYSVFICTFNLLTINAKKLTFRMAGVFHKLSSFFYQSSILAPKMTNNLFERFKYDKSNSLHDVYMFIWVESFILPR